MKSNQYKYSNYTNSNNSNNYNNKRKQREELTKRTTKIQRLINEILKNVKSEKNQYWKILPSLKTFLHQEMTSGGQAGQVKYEISEWEKLTSDKEILLSVKGAKTRFDIQPEIVSLIFVTPNKDAKNTGFTRNT